jgi:hypothetical protein
MVRGEEVLLPLFTPASASVPITITRGFSAHLCVLRASAFLRLPVISSFGVFMVKVAPSSSPHPLHQFNLPDSLFDQRHATT